MTLAEAKALLEQPSLATPTSMESEADAAVRNTLYEVADADADRAGLKQLARHCERFTPRFGIEEAAAAENLWLDLNGSLHLFGGEQGTAVTLTTEFRENGLQARIGLAPNFGAAWAVAHCLAGPSAPVVVPQDKLTSTLDPLPVEALRLTPKILSTLHELGLRTIRQVRSLDRSTLPARFGPLLLQRLDQAFGAEFEQLDPERPLEAFLVEWAGEFPIVDPEGMQVVSRELVEQLLSRLKPHRLGVRQLQCELRDGSGKQHLLEVSFVVPADQSRHVFEMLNLQWERGGLPTEIVRVRLEAVVTESQRVVQRDLFGHEINADRQRDIATLIDRLSNRLGVDRVVRATLQPEAQPELAVDYEAWTRQDASVGVRSVSASSRPRPYAGGAAASAQVASRDRQTSAMAVSPAVQGRGREAVNALTRAGPQRPTHLFAEPQPIRVSIAGPEGAPMSFWWQKREHRVIRSWGPERIETGWWRESPTCRDYFRVEVQTGHHFWLFHCFNAQNWFVHGTFE